MRSNAHLSAALTGITAAVVGVIANLAVFFALHTLFDASRTLGWGPVDLDVPVISAGDPVAFALTGIALAMVFWLRWSTLRVLGVCALLGLVVSLLR